MLIVGLVTAAVTAAGAVRDGWFEEMVPMGDGVRLYTYGAVPPKGTKCPVVIKRTPYSPERPINGADFARQQAEAIRRGYAYVCQHARGSTSSRFASRRSRTTAFSPRSPSWCSASPGRHKGGE